MGFLWTKNTTNSKWVDGAGEQKRNFYFQSVSTIAGQEVQWALGAMIYHMRFFPLRDSARNLIVKEWVMEYVA